MHLADRRILVTGSLGMLAGDLIPLLFEKNAKLVLTDIRDEKRWGEQISFLDITDPKAVRNFVKDIHPEIIINCSAFTNVDAAETEQNIAFAVNARGPGNLASAARDFGARLVHLSTDYVFGGLASEDRGPVPYREEDTPDPCGISGHSKRFGDELVRGILPDNHLLLRTSWLHGIHGPNFVDTILSVGKQKEEIKVVDDQFGSPTWATWLATVIVKLLERDGRGTFHATSRGGVSWFEFAKEIIKLAHFETHVTPQSTHELGRPAPRPAYSTLDVRKLEKFLGEPCLTWQAGIVAHLSSRGISA